MPRKKTIRRTQLGPRARRAVVVDGRTLRGAARADGRKIPLSAALDDTSRLVLTGLDIGTRRRRLPLHSTFNEKRSIFAAARAAPIGSRTYGPYSFVTAPCRMPGCERPPR